MFADAIEQISIFIKPEKLISRYYGSYEVIPGTAILFFVNEKGVAIKRYQFSVVHNFLWEAN